MHIVWPASIRWYSQVDEATINDARQLSRKMTFSCPILKRKKQNKKRYNFIDKPIEKVLRADLYERYNNYFYGRYLWSAIISSAKFMNRCYRRATWRQSFLLRTANEIIHQMPPDWSSWPLHLCKQVVCIVCKKSCTTNKKNTY